jgi:hypothetical protein
MKLFYTQARKTIQDLVFKSVCCIPNVSKQRGKEKFRVSANERNTFPPTFSPQSSHYTDYANPGVKYIFNFGINKVKQFHYRPGQALRVPGVSGSQIS